eukprot:1333708-Amorphochlora_amoeboformis.AAC.1
MNFLQDQWVSLTTDVRGGIRLSEYVHLTCQRPSEHSENYIHTTGVNMFPSPAGGITYIPRSSAYPQSRPRYSAEKYEDTLPKAAYGWWLGVGPGIRGAMDVGLSCSETTQEFRL